MTAADGPATKPLEGVRVLEIGAYIAGPYCGALLASLGADVVKVEPPRTGDPFRRGAANRDAYFLQYNAGKRSICVDLKSETGVALVKSLLPRFDVLIENNRPGKIASLGLGAEVCRAINPKLVYASVSGFGDGGPLRDRPAYDSIGQSISGHYSLMNDPGNVQLTGGAAADLMSGLVATLSVVSALVGRGRGGGGGSLVKTSLMEAMSAITIDAVTNYYERRVTPTRQSRHGQAQAFCLASADGRAITLHLSVSEKFWRKLACAMGREDLTEDRRFVTYGDRMANYSELEAILKAEFLKRDSAHWEEVLLAADVPFASANTIEDVISHPQTAWLQMMEPERNGVALVRPPWTIDGARLDRNFDAPLLGADTRAIAAEIMPSDQVDRLIEEGVLYASAR